MWKQLVALALVISLSGCFGGGQEGRAFDFVTSEVQAKQRIFKDQYDLSMPLDNSRGSVVVVAITDKKLISDDGNKFLVYLLTKQQDSPKYYLTRYSRVFLKEKPTKDKIAELARDEGFL